MKLKELLHRIKTNKVIGSLEIEINSITADSRKVCEGTCFIAIPGTKVDGHDFIEDTINKGVSAIVCTHISDTIDYKNVSIIIVDNSTECAGIIASAFYNYPSEKLTLTGVTGTNGKTTTATLLYKTFKSLGHKSGLLSTVENYVDEKCYPATQTTPDIFTINKLLAEMVNEGCEYCFMEVSSHAIAQKRIAGLNFKLGIFSNITLDHLDYHKTFAEYIKAKKLFFDNLPKTAFALTNGDDKNGMVMVQNSKAKIKTYGLKNFYDFKATILECNFEGMLMNICGREMWTFLPGQFNAYNILAVYSAATLLGINSEEVLTVLSGQRSVKGRFDIVNEAGITAIVDYAHTPDALENVLKTIQNIRCKNQKIITVCGCGGDRDKSKRPLMAKIAVEYSDKVILTSDNPRTENPETILDEMFAGLNTEKLKAKAIRITDRKSAIQASCLAAQKNDIILIAGKGHENYQDVNGVKSHFDDKEIVSQQLQQIKNIN
ncbi:MAG: UDP-N-acetylmuramoyl-L-alanyl-D-glutamate--2,6-diaminopimelate ligase [Bacteroidales bacterium]|nr:UDP-N-acetylmuramoyl-L-alanyl-D-glutamate--2,6-diaminopimelate ligase [Bacteroidales bacterium]